MIGTHLMVICDKAKLLFYGHFIIVIVIIIYLKVYTPISGEFI